MNKGMDNRLFSVSGCITQKALLDYVAGRMEHAEKLSVEEHLTRCLLCSDALDGVAAMKGSTEPESFIDGLRKEVIASGSKKNKANKTDRRRTAFIWSAAAAIVTIIFISWFSLSRMQDAPEKTTITENLEMSPDSRTAKGEAARADSVAAPKEKSKTDEITKFGEVTVQDIVTTGGKGYYMPDYKNYRWDADSVAVTTKFSNDNQSGEDLKDQTVMAGEQQPVSEQSEGKLEEDKNLETKSLNQEVITIVTDEEEQQNKKKDVTKSSGKKNQKETEPERAVGGATGFELDGIITASPDQLFAEAMSFYNAGDHSGAINKFEAVLRQNVNYDAARYYCALSYHKTGKHKKAIDYLDYLLKNEAGSFYELAQWQKALILIDTGEVNKARKLLADIVSGKGTFSTHAADKLTEIGQ